MESNVKIYTLKVPVALGKDIYYKLIEKVSIEKRRRVERFSQLGDVYRTLLADVLVRSIISRTFQVENEEINFRYNDFGKPFVEMIPKFFFNISHSCEWIVCATSNSHIGIDIEKIRPIDIRIAKRFFSNEEYEDLIRQPKGTHLSYFYDLWTLKESYIKAVGKGLFIPLDSFSVKKYSKDNISLSKSTDNNNNLFFKQYKIDEEYKLSVCAANQMFSKEVIARQLSELFE